MTRLSRTAGPGVACPDEAATRAAGRDLAGRLARGDLVLVEGDLGAGKTVFVRGLAEGLGIAPGEVSSPTFALVHEYGPDGAEPVLAHVDLYRLAVRPGSLEELGLRDLRGRGAIVAVEWPAAELQEEGAWTVSIVPGVEGGRLVSIARLGPPLPPGSGRPEAPEDSGKV